MKAKNIVLYPVRHIKNTAQKAGRRLSEDQISQILEQVHHNTNNQGHPTEKIFRAHLTLLVNTFIGAQAGGY
jgi:hypothetical protein